MKTSLSAAPVPPLVGLAFGILAVSSSSILIRFAQQDAPSLAIAAMRLSFAGLILAPVALSRRREELASLSRRELAWLLLSGLFLAFHFATWVTSLEYTSVASSVVLVATTPLWVALLGFLILREPVQRILILALVISLAGSVIVGLSNACQFTGTRITCVSAAALFAGPSLPGNLLALAGALFAAGYLLVGRRLRSRLSLLTYIFIVYASAGVFLIAGALIFAQPLTGYPPRLYLLCLGLAVFPQLLGHSMYNWALKYLSATYVSLGLLGEPVGTTILAYLILHQPPTSLEMIGGSLLLVGIYLASRSS